MTNDHAHSDRIRRAVSLLHSGGLVAFPTETVYGLGADAFNPSAVAKIFEAKGRPANRPLIAHVSDIEMARRVVSDWPALAQDLAEAFWPGPLTLVLPRHERVPGIVTSGGPTVGVRSPDHPMARSLIESFGGPVVGTSANRSDAVSPTCAEHVRASFGDRVLVLDGGSCRQGIESTVVRVDGRSLDVLRLGMIGIEDLRRFSGEVSLASGPSSGADGFDTPMRLVDADQIESVRRALENSGKAVAVLGIGTEVVFGRPMPGEAGAYARALYSALREVDALGADVILIERPTGMGPIWDTVRDRLARVSCRDAD